jgi:hypothetical protein
LSVSELACRDETSAGAVAMRLARARSALRVEFILAFRRTVLPSNRCRQVLLALSAGDQRRQLELGTADHLARCPTCAGLAEPLAKRRRGAAAWWAFPMPAWLRRLARHLRRSHTTQAVLAATIVVVVNGPARPVHSTHAAPAPATTPAASAAPQPSPASTTPAPTVPPSTTLAASVPSACPPGPAPTMTVDAAGCTYTLTGLRVTEVPAKEGFWIQDANGNALWVHLVGAGESPEHIEPGQSLTVRATINAVSPSADAGIPPSQAARFDAQSVYLSVAYADLTVDASP